jgi:hypothetical protein
MSLTREHIQEDLSVAYISAVAAKAGYDCGNCQKHDYGIDLEINPIEIGDEGERYTYGMPLRVQAKASYGVDLSHDDFIKFNLRARNYNILARDTGRGPPSILVLYCMPPEDHDWLSIEENHTTLKHCGYWASLRGKDLTRNTSTIGIKIPRAQVFNESSLKQIMEMIQSEGHL